MKLSFDKESIACEEILRMSDELQSCLEEDEEPQTFADIESRCMDPIGISDSIDFDDEFCWEDGDEYTDIEDEAREEEGGVVSVESIDELDELHEDLKIDAILLDFVEQGTGLFSASELDGFKKERDDTDAKT